MTVTAIRVSSLSCLVWFGSAICCNAETCNGDLTDEVALYDRNRPVAVRPIDAGEPAKFRLVNSLAQKAETFRFRWSADSERFDNRPVALTVVGWSSKATSDTENVDLYRPQNDFVKDEFPHQTISLLRYGQLHYYGTKEARLSSEFHYRYSQNGKWHWTNDPEVLKAYQFDGVQPKKPEPENFLAAVFGSLFGTGFASEVGKAPQDKFHHTKHYVYLLTELHDIGRSGACIDFEVNIANLGVDTLIVKVTPLDRLRSHHSSPARHLSFEDGSN